MESRERNVTVSEERVPLDGIADSAAELIELYGGHITLEQEGELRFFLPVRRGAASAGGTESVMAWVEAGDGGGTVTITAAQTVGPPRFQRVALLVVGVVGSFLWLLWPFFPHLAPLAFIGGAIAFATYLITLRSSSPGTAQDLLQKLARRQRELASESEGE